MGRNSLHYKNTAQMRINQGNFKNFFIISAARVASKENLAENSVPQKSKF
jgi:hypothetical protein